MEDIEGRMNGRKGNSLVAAATLISFRLSDIIVTLIYISIASSHRTKEQTLHIVEKRETTNDESQKPRVCSVCVRARVHWRLLCAGL